METLVQATCFCVELSNSYNQVISTKTIKCPVVASTDESYYLLYSCLLCF